MSVLRSVRTAVVGHMLKTGRAPTQLYVSEADYDAIKREVEALTHAPYGVSEGDPDMVEGLVIHRVTGGSKLAVE